MILCVISMFIYVCECIGLRNIVIMMYMYLTMLYPINDLNLNLKITLWNTLSAISRISLCKQDNQVDDSMNRFNCFDSYIIFSKFWQK